MVAANTWAKANPERCREAAFIVALIEQNKAAFANEEVAKVDLLAKLIAEIAGPNELDAVYLLGVRRGLIDSADARKLPHERQN